MEAAADQVRAAAGKVEGTLIPQLSYEVNLGLSGMDTAGTPEHAKSMEAYVSAPPYYLPSAADQCRQPAYYTQTSAGEVPNMKVQATVRLASMLSAIAIGLV